MPGIDLFMNSTQHMMLMATMRISTENLKERSKRNVKRSSMCNLQNPKSSQKFLKKVDLTLL